MPNHIETAMMCIHHAQGTMVNTIAVCKNILDQFLAHVEMSFCQMSVTKIEQTHESLQIEVICYLTCQPGPNVIKLFTSVIYELFVASIPTQPILMFMGKGRSLPRVKNLSRAPL
jgi:hypothetical protein